jgi:hypothetical protein
MTLRSPGIAFGFVALLACTALPAAAQQGTPEPSSRRTDPEEVRFFIYVLDIDDVADQEQYFAANFALRLRWVDERLVHPGPTARFASMEDVWNPQVLLMNRQDRLRTALPEVVEIEPDGTVTYRQQYVGRLSQRLDLSRFPLDSQELNLSFMRGGTGQLRFVPDTQLGIQQNAGGTMAAILSLPDWEVTEYYAEERPYVIAETLQEPGFAFTIRIRRYFAYYFWQMILPMILIVMMSWTPFWIHPSKAETQFSLAAAAVLTLIAYRFALGSLLPRLSYLTRMDYLTLWSTLLVFGAGLQVLVTSRMAFRDHIPLALRVDQYSRVLFPALLIGALIWILLM